ncbi:hypothetical protein AB1Y20_006121 [Prymnesium parvum]|uniref:DUF3293 domain-containing protein n=1 Tax=Prymnesium parvum TaxID=97485 RepID=A0AB34J333_PRYPA|mmetsp:Transcript_23868/g.59291  ORF Transcript_23868/g.59291 Transcript_23868/m.59291 type:complete len:225 (-) Transcript_23868:161-835(-)
MALLRRALCLGGASAASALTSSAGLSGMGDSVLGALWGSAIDGHLLSSSALTDFRPAADNAVLYLAPSRAPPLSSGEWPAAFASHTVFSLTAWNPMGQDEALDVNQKANRALQRDIGRLQPPPKATWHSFGFNVGENWREDGFSIQYAPDVADQGGREAVLSLARKYRQAAVYEYSCRDGHLERSVVWCCPDKQAAHGGEPERMEIVSRAPDSELSRVVWSGTP